MAFRQVAQPTKPVDVYWGDQFEISSDIVGKKREVGVFLLRINADMSVEPRCMDGTVDGATYYVERWLDYHKSEPDYGRFVAGRDASTIVYDKCTGQLVAVCMVAGSSSGSCAVYDILVDPAYRNQEIGTRMLHRALGVLHDKGFPELHLWRNDDDRAARLYERLGFVLTGEVEEPHGSDKKTEPTDPGVKQLDEGERNFPGRSVYD